MKPFFKRLAYLIIGWGMVGVCYHSSATLQREPYLLPVSFIDQWIAFRSEERRVGKECRSWRAPDDSKI